MPSDQERLATLEAKTTALEDSNKTMADDIKDIKDNLLKRPSWAVTIIITILSTLCTGLIVFVATKF